LTSGASIATAIAAGAIVNADISASAEIAHNKLAPLGDGQILIGNANNIPTARAVTGDITISRTGVTAIAAGTIVNADIDATAVGANAYSYMQFGSAGAGEATGEIGFERTTGRIYIKQGANSSPSTALIIDNSSRVGIGTTSPGQLLEVNGNIQGGNFLAPSAATYGVASNTRIGIVPTSVTNERLEFHVGTSERARIDSSGRLLVGTSTARTNVAASTPQTQLEGTSFDTSIYSAVRNSNDNGGANLILAKSRGTAVGSNTVVQSADQLGVLRFTGSDGTNFVTGASIAALVDGTPGANDMPGRLVFSTTADGAISPTERMRIANDGGTFITGASTSLSLSNTAAAGATIALVAGRHSATAGTAGSGTLSFVVYTNGNVLNTNNSYGAISDIKLKRKYR
jgi:hypothetical protein